MPKPRCRDKHRKRGRPGIGVLVDTLHFDRSGSTIDQVARTPHLRLPFAHVADAPVQKSYATEELLHAGPAERLPPVEGEIDIRRVPEHMPDGIPVAHRSAHDCDGGDRKFSSRRASRTTGGIAAVGD